MCVAVPVAALLLILFAGLTLLRLQTERSTPNADLVSDMLNTLEDERPRHTLSETPECGPGSTYDCCPHP